MKFVLPLLARFNEATITLNAETFTDFNTAFHIAGTNVPMGPTLKASFSGDVKASMDLFQGKFSMIDSGESVTTADCKTSPYAKYSIDCRTPFLTSTVQHGAGEIFIDATTGKFGVKSHNTATAREAGIQGAFCAVVNVPVKSYPPPSMLKSKINAAVFKRVEDRLNSNRHTEHDGIATFHTEGMHMMSNYHGYETAFANNDYEIHTDGGAPVKAEMHVIAFDPHTSGFSRHVVGSASMTFSKWTSPATALTTFTGCPDGSTTNLHAHPEATRSLASLNAVVQMLRQHDDLGWLPEDPAAYFMAQLEQQGQEPKEYERDEQEIDAESEDAQWPPMVASLLAGVVSGGGVVLALFNLATKKQRQVPLLSDA